MSSSARYIPPASQRMNKHLIVCLGDSQTDPEDDQGLSRTQWTAVLERRLRTSGGLVRVADYARAGAKTDAITTTGMVNRLVPFQQWFKRAGQVVIPDLAIILAGGNDSRLISGVTLSGTTATYTSTAHGYLNGNAVSVVGFDQAGYNVTFAVVQNVTTNTFDIPNIVGSPATPGTSTGSGGKAWAYLDTTTNIRAMIRFYGFGCRNVYSSQTLLPVGGIDGQRHVVLYDTSTTGGKLPTNAATQLPNITGAVTGEPTVWEYRSGQQGNNGGAATIGEAGWGRVGTHQTTPTHVQRFLIPNSFYQNLSSGGDNYSGGVLTELYNYSSSNAAGVRSLQRAAATLENSPNVVFLDAFTYFKNYIVNGTYVQGQGEWNVSNANQHLSELGHSMQADCLHQAILGQQDWLKALSL